MLCQNMLLQNIIILQEKRILKKNLFIFLKIKTKSTTTF